MITKIEEIPIELQQAMDANDEAKVFFESLSISAQKAYCSWVGSAKQAVTRQSRAEKAVKMLKNHQKTLKIVNE